MDNFQKHDTCFTICQYLLMFQKGEDGYHFELKWIDSVSGLNTSKKVSAMDFYANRIIILKNPENHLHRYIVKTTGNKYICNLFIR